MPSVSLVMFLVGLANGWSSPYLAQLSLKESVDGIPRATDEQLSWVASLMNVGRIFGAGAGAVFQGKFVCFIFIFHSFGQPDKLNTQTKL
jgi:predicted MFS family arabinose efflux permease